MITPAYASTMTAYNEAMNARIYAAASRLSDAERRRERGAFWGSIHATLSHLVWADSMWMSRFDGWDAPTQPLKQSGGLFADFGEMAATRCDIDARLQRWASGLTDTWLSREQTWHSGSAGREITAPRALLVAHLFNHQTHHRGQVHAMLTAAGQPTGDTDLPLVLAR